MNYKIVCPQCSSIIDISESLSNQIKADLIHDFESESIKLKTELLSKITEVELLKIEQESNVLKIKVLQEKLEEQFEIIERAKRNQSNTK